MERGMEGETRAEGRRGRSHAKERMREVGGESWRRSSGEVERWPACEEGRSGWSGRGEAGGALFGGQAPDEAERRLVAVWARHGLGASGIVVEGNGIA